MKTLRVRKGLFTGIVLFLVLVGILVWPAILPVNTAVSQAQTEVEYYVIPMKVNVLKGVTIGNDSIGNMVKECNSILKQANVEFDFDQTKDIDRDVSDGGNNDGNLTSDERLNLMNPAAAELKLHFHLPTSHLFQGYKVYITNGFPDEKSDVVGLTLQAKAGTKDPPAFPVSFVVNRDPITGPCGMGATLAHECAHGMTVAYDDTSDPLNLMHIPCDPKGNNTLTDAQKERIHNGAKQIGKKNDKIGAHSSIISVDTKREYWVDDSGDVSQGYIDLYLGSLFAEGPTADLKITICLSGLYPNGTDVNTTFQMGFDTDNNSSTGYYGIDKLLQINLQGKYPFTSPNGSISADLYDIASGTSKLLTPGEVARIQEIADVWDPPAPEPLDCCDSIIQSLPLSLLDPLADVVPIYLWATNLDTGEYDYTSFEFNFNPPPGATIEMEPLEAQPGQIVAVQGTRFPPLSTVTLLIDDTEILQTTTLTDGTFVTSFAVLDPTPSWYFVTARSNPFDFDFSVLDIGIPGPAPCTVYTPLGSSVSVSLCCGSVTFNSVTNAGNTTATAGVAPCSLGWPAGYVPVGPAYHITTANVTYTSPVNVGISYNDAGIPTENDLVLFHCDGTGWDPVTTSVDTVSNIVYGQDSTLSWWQIGDPPGPSGGGGGGGVPVFPSVYIGIGAALGAAGVAYLLRRRFIVRR